MKLLTVKRTVPALLVIALSCSGCGSSSGNSGMPFSRIPPTTVSPSGNSVVADCGDFPNAMATLWVDRQANESTDFTVTLVNGAANTLYTVWLRVKGNDRTGSFGGSPLTNGGSTPMASGTALDSLESSSPWNSVGTLTPENGFTTDGFGAGELTTTLNFPLFGGRYPFNEISDANLANLVAVGPLGAATRDTPLAIVNPDDVNVSAPFMLRIVSHCTDGLGHGLSPGNREGWFNFP